MPMTAFIGVRISWLMFARNSVFARLAASAASRAAVSSPSTRLRSPMSLEIDTKPGDRAVPQQERRPQGDPEDLSLPGHVPDVSAEPAGARRRR